VKILGEDKQAGIDRLTADRDRCIGLEKELPKYFEGTDRSYRVEGAGRRAMR